MLALASVALVVTYLVVARNHSSTPARVVHIRDSDQGPRSATAEGATRNVYAATAAVRADIAGGASRVYVPSGIRDIVTVIDPATKQIEPSQCPGKPLRADQRMDAV